MKKKGFLRLVVIVTACLLGAWGWRFVVIRKNPFPDVVFLETVEGHTGTFNVFTPVWSHDHSVALGPSLTAQNGVIRFYDWDGDRKPDVIVETPDSWFDFGEYTTRSRHVLRYHWDEEHRRPSFQMISSKVGPSTEY